MNEVMTEQDMNESEVKRMERCNDKLTNRDICEALWECRNFEITTLWQRSAMLGVFMVATYAGYGALILNAPDNGLSRGGFFFNGLAVGTCCFGMLFSMLWILMLKGSKCWYEICESALNAFWDGKLEGVDSASVNVFDIFLSKEVKAVFDKNHKFSGDLSSPNGGPYSVSRVAIAIGQVSLLGWVILAVCHVGVMAWQCWSAGSLLPRLLVAVVAIVLFLGCLGYGSVKLKKRSESSNLLKFLSEEGSVGE